MALSYAEAEMLGVFFEPELTGTSSFFNIHNSTLTKHAAETQCFHF
jgi:hypothetical protein